MALLIGCQGRARNGKSTTAEAMVSRANHKGLYAESYELTKYIIEDGIQTGRLPKGTVRSKMSKDEIDILIEIGQGRREEDQDYWLKKLEPEIEEDHPDVAIVPNIRQENES